MSWLTVAQPAMSSRLLLVRHGRTEMNEHLAVPGNEWGARYFNDPGLYDTVLTAEGEAQARRLNAHFIKRPPNVELLICSPLRRALHTADIAFQGIGKMQRIVTPLAAERLFLSSDVGSPVADLLAARFDTSWNFDAVADPWWHQPTADAEWRPPGKYCTHGEPQHAFDERMRCLIALLQSHDDVDTSIALVCHSEVIFALTGKRVANCDCLELRTSELRSPRA